MTSFFSVCIPLLNRGKTIFSTLSSIAEQAYRNFDVKIVVYKGVDNTNEEVTRFFASNIYSQNKFEYEIEYSDKAFDDWNGPVKIAKGKYIAMLEGDDQFTPEHLHKAYKYLSKNNNVGIYSTGNQNKKRELFGLIKSADYFRYIYSMVAVPPPSETIFVRLDKNSCQYYYNHASFIYAPEIDLYLRIAGVGYDAYYANSQDVWRYPSSYKQNSWKYFHDPFAIVNKYKNSSGITTELFVKTKHRIAILALKYFLMSIYRKDGVANEFQEHLINELGILQFCKYLVQIISNKIVKVFLLIGNGK